jgi:hypothetical protein
LVVVEGDAGVTLAALACVVTSVAGGCHLVTTGGELGLVRLATSGELGGRLPLVVLAERNPE